MFSSASSLQKRDGLTMAVSKGLQEHVRVGGFGEVAAHPLAGGPCLVPTLRGSVHVEALWPHIEEGRRAVTTWKKVETLR